MRITRELFEMWASYRHCLNTASWHLKVRANQKHLLQKHYITLLSPVLFQAQQKGCAAFCSKNSKRTDKDGKHPDFQMSAKNKNPIGGVLYPARRTDPSGLFVHAVHDTHGNDLMTTISGHYSAIDVSCCKNGLAVYTFGRLPHSNH